MSIIYIHSKGKTYQVLIDKEFEYLNQWKWYLSSNGYAYRQSNKKSIFLHRIINNTPEGLFTDHINRIRIDNRKSNLRTVGKRVNSINRIEQKNNTSGYKGISWSKNAKKWSAFIFSFGKKYHLGYYQDIKDSIKARKDGEKRYHAIS